MHSVEQYQWEVDRIAEKYITSDKTIIITPRAIIKAVPGKLPAL